MKKRIHVATKESKEIGGRIKELRTSMELTQKQLGEMAFISQNHISNIEKGVENVSDDAIARLSTALKTSFMYLKTGDLSSLKKNEKKMNKKEKNTMIPGQMSLFDFCC